MSLPTEMRAAVVSSFGGQIQIQNVPVPDVGPKEVLLRVHYADVAVWDPLEREGEFAEMYEQLHGRPPGFPLVLGGEGAGEVVAVGDGVSSPSLGERVWAGAFLNPKGGFYAEYAVVPAEQVGPVPGGLTLEQAAVLSGDGLTALRGLQDHLKVQRGESVAVFGASGGLGHFAVQLAQRLGARVLAVASGADGVERVRGLGIDTVIDGRREDIAAAARSFARDGLDAALLAAGGDAAEALLGCVRRGGRAAYPRGVLPEPRAPEGVDLHVYDGDPDADIIDRLNRLVAAGPFGVEIARTFDLEEVASAHEMLKTHYVGKLALRLPAAQ